MVADILIKPLNKAKHLQCIRLLQNEDE